MFCSDSDKKIQSERKTVMKNKKTLIAILAVVVVAAVALLIWQPWKQPEAPQVEKKSYDITIWVADKAVDLTKQQIADFNASNEEFVFNATIEAVSEADAATQMITDVEAGGDIFCFAQDQFARLVQAGALSKLGVKAAETVTADNDASTVAAATSGDTLYAYPLTSDNGYFLYYDKSVIPDADVDSLEKLIADCEGAQRYFAFEQQTSAWYLASFFFATGCKSEWTTDDEGNFISVNDTFNSPEGLIAVKGMKKLVDSPFHLSAGGADQFNSGAAVLVSGTWDFEAVKGILGDNMGVADLPSFEVDGKEYHLGSFSGCKLMGVKPQTDAEKAAAVHKLAQYLTGEKAQMERFEALAWGPSNKNDQASEKVQSNPGLAALLAQSTYATPQGQIHGSWWDIAKVIGEDVKAAADDDGLQQALTNYYNKINSLFNLDNSALLFVGAWNGWNNADEADTYYFKDNTLTLDVPESDYMGGRIVNPGKWDTDKGFAQVTTGAELIKDLGADNPDNNIVFAEAGNYTLTIDGDAITIVKN